MLSFSLNMIFFQPCCKHYMILISAPTSTEFYCQPFMNMIKTILSSKTRAERLNDKLRLMSLLYFGIISPNSGAILVPLDMFCIIALDYWD